MSTLAETYVACCLHLLQDPSSQQVSLASASEVADFVQVLETLDILLANLALSLVLLDRYKANTVNSLCLGDTCALNTAYYAMIASLILANKYMNDQSYTIKTWHSILAKCSRLAPTLAFLNQLESHFLSALGYSVGTTHDKNLWSRFAHVDQCWLQQLRTQVDESLPCVVSAVSPSTAIPSPPVSVTLSHQVSAAAAVAAAPPAPQKMNVAPVMPTPPSMLMPQLVPLVPSFAPLSVTMAPVVNHFLPAYCLGQQLQSHLHCTPVPTPPSMPPSMPRGHRYVPSQSQFREPVEEYVPLTPVQPVKRRKRDDDNMNTIYNNNINNNISIGVGQNWFGQAPMGARMGYYKHY